MSTLRAYLDRWSDYVAARPALLFGFAAMLLLVQIGPWWYSAPDSACYLSMGRSFWDGDGPTALGDKYKAYAIGYSLLLSPLFWISERPFVLIGTLHFVLAGVIAVGVYRWASGYGQKAATFAVAFTLTHACFCLYFRKPLSEMAYMAVMYWTVMILDRVRTAASDRERNWFALAGIVMLLVTLNFRHNGVLLAPGFAVALAFDAWRRGTGYLRALLLGGFTVALAFGVFQYERYLDDRWLIEGRNMTHWQWMAGKETSKVAQYLEGTRLQMLEFLRVTVPGALKTHLKSPSWLTPNALLAVAATLPLVYGYYLMLRRRADVFLCTVPFFLAINVMYSNDQGGRYTLPLLPVIAVALWVLIEQTKLQPQRVLMPLLAVHIVAGIGYWVGVDLPRTRELDRNWRDMEALMAQIGPDHERVAALDLTVPDCDRLKYTLDRHVFNLNLHDEIKSDPNTMRWIIAPPTAAVPTGFEPFARQGAFQLLRHTTLTQAPTLAAGADAATQRR
jgi:hypothetical protein